MSSRTPDLLSNIFASGLQPRAATFPRGMIPMKSRGSGEASGDAFVPPASRRRTAIWDMHHSMHCSIIGTCLSTSEIRRLLIKLGVHGAESASDHDLHKQGVTLQVKRKEAASSSRKRWTGAMRPRLSNSQRRRTKVRCASYGTMR